MATNLIGGIGQPPHVAGSWQARAGEQPARWQLLLVDSERSSRIRLQHALSMHGFAVRSVGGMRAALEQAAKITFDHAVVEMRLPDGHGLSLLRNLLQAQQDMRVVVHTDFDSFASVVLALRAGAADYLTKPTDPAELVEALHGTLGAQCRA